MDDLSCLFCSEPETVHDLFFDCCVASVMWLYLSDIFDIQLGLDFESVVRWWICNKKWCVEHVLCCIDVVLMETAE